MEVISSRAHPVFKQLLKLERSSRYRKKTGMTILDGCHLIAAYQMALGPPINLITSQSGIKCEEIKTIIHNQVNKIFIFNDSLFRAASPVKSPTGIMAIITIPVHKTIAWRSHNRFLVLLESIQDPGNLGSIVRSAAAAGVGSVYLSKDCAQAWSPKVLRAAMGAHFLLPIYEQANLAEIARQFNGNIIATTVQAKKSLFQTPLTGPVAFIFGNEGKGLSNEMVKIATQQICIPMPGKTESLNAASAAAICLFERVRQTTNKQHSKI